MIMMAANVQLVPRMLQQRPGFRVATLRLHLQHDDSVEQFTAKLAAICSFGWVFILLPR
jgi:hypothetical protein